MKKFLHLLALFCLLVVGTGTMQGVEKLAYKIEFGGTKDDTSSSSPNNFLTNCVKESSRGYIYSVSTCSNIFQQIAGFKLSSSNYAGSLTFEIEKDFQVIPCKIVITASPNGSEKAFTFNGESCSAESEDYKITITPKTNSKLTEMSFSAAKKVRPVISSVEVYVDEPDTEQPDPTDKEITLPSPISGKQVVFAFPETNINGEVESRKDAAQKMEAEGICTLECLINKESNEIFWPKNSPLKVTPVEDVTITRVYWTNNDGNEIDFNWTGDNSVVTGTNKIDKYWEGELSTPFTITPTNGNIHTYYFLVEYTKKEVIEPEKGTQDNPYNIQDVKNQKTDVNNIWVEGYIVGYAISGNNYTTDPSKISNTNFALAPSPDSEEFIPVELPTKNDIRSQLNIVDHSNYIGRHIKIYGNITAYFSVRGLKAPTEYEWLDELEEEQPALPVVKIGEETLVNGGTKTIEQDTDITISSENATKLMVSVNGENYEEQSNPYTFTIGDNTELKVYGINDTYTSENNVFTFTFNYETADPENPGEANDGKYILITSLDELGDSAECIIVNTEASKAMMPYSTGNNLKATDVTINDKTIIITTENVQEVTIAKYDGGFYTLAVGENSYLAATGTKSGNNYLKPVNYIDNPSKARITFDGNNADIKFNLTTSGLSNWLRFNSSNNPNLFACYSTGQKPVQLYKKVEVSEPTPVLGELTYTVTGDKIIKDEEITVDLNDVFTFSAENATDIKVMLDVDDTQVEANGEFKDGTYIWTISECYELVYVTVTPYLNDTEGETLEFLLTVNKPVETDPNMPAVGSNFKQIMNGDEITEGYYVIGRHFISDTNPVHVAMSLDDSKDRINSTTNVEFDDFKVWTPDITNDNFLTKDMSLITTKGDDILIVYIEKNNDKYSIRTVNYGDGSKDSQGYLAVESEEKTTLKIVPDFTEAFIEINIQNNANIYFSADHKRTIGTSSDGAYFNYQTSGGAIQLYQYTTAKHFKPEFDDIIMDNDKNYPIEPRNANDLPQNAPTLIYEIKSGNTYLEIDKGSNIIRPKGNNSKDREDLKVAVMWREVPNEWFSGIIEIPVTLRRFLDSDEFGFRYSHIRGKEGIGINAQAAYYLGTGTLTYKVYETYDTDNAIYKEATDVTINSETGMIRPQDIENAQIDHIYTVEATASGAVEHMDAKRTYTFQIEEPGSIGVTTQFDFTQKGAYGLYDGFGTSNTSGDNNIYANTYEKDRPDGLKPVEVFREGDVLIEMGEGNYRLFNQENQGYQLRMHKNNSMTISSSSKKIKSIEFDQYQDKINVNSNSGGTYSNGKWTSTSQEGVNSVTFTANDTHRIYTITIEFVTENNGKAEAGLSFDVSDEDVNHYFNFFEDETVKLPKLLHNEGMDDKFADMIANKSLVFDIDEVSNDESAKSDKDVEYVDYTITPTDFDNVTVQVSEPGVYTLRASYEGDDYLPGFAILRLNVFPRLDVQPDKSEHLAKDSRNDVPNLTIVSAGQDNNYWNNPVDVKIPSIAYLEDQYKYSTVKITKVVISELNNNESLGETTDTYEGENLSNVPEYHPFSCDGRITYTITYANTPDFSMEETVHIIHHPYLPIWSKGSDNTIIMEPSKHALLEYAVFDQEDAKWETTPEASRIRKAEKQDDSFYKTLKFEQAENGAGVELEPGKSVVFRSVKDLSNLNLALEDNILASPYLVVNMPKDGQLTEIDGIEAEEFDADALYFNLQGVRVLRPERGVYIKVKGDKSSKVVF